MMAEKNDEHKYERWLEGTDACSAPDPLTQALDELLSAGPSDQASARARQRLQRALDAQRLGTIYYDLLPDSVLGPIYLAVNERGLVAIEFEEDEEIFLQRLHSRMDAEMVRSPERVAAAANQLRAYLAGQRAAFDLPIDIGSLTTFQRDVLMTVMKVPRGEVTTYGDLAKRIGRPKAARAVGQALGNNPIPIVIPCHRVLTSDGSLGGYSGREGVKTKEKLLRLEGALP